MDDLGRSETEATSDHLGHDKAVDKQTWGLDSGATEWTDEKHSLYLKSMEASFVNQLYSSVDVPSWNSLKRNDISSSKQMHCPSGQFKVLRHGSWQKLNFERPEFQLNKTAHNSQALSANPWIRHFKSECKPKTLVPPNPPGIAGSKIVINLSRMKAVSCEAATRSERIDASHLCHHDLSGSSAEVSDQNFIDEEIEDQNFVDEEIKGEKASSISSSKKMKTEEPDSSSHDQVVPIPQSNRPMTENNPEKCVFPAR